MYYKICHIDASFMPVFTVGRDAADRFFYYTMELADDAQTDSPLPAASSAPPGEVEAQIKRYEPKTLRSELQRHGRLPTPQCVGLGIALAAGLEKLHAHGLIHRACRSWPMLALSRRSKRPIRWPGRRVICRPKGNVRNRLTSTRWAKSFTN